MELSSLVNRLGSTLSTSVLSFKLIALIVIEILIILKQYPKFLCAIPKQGQISLDMHRVTCLVVMGYPVDSEQVC